MKSLSEITEEQVEELIGRKVSIKFKSLSKSRIGYLIDVYQSNDSQCFLVLELGFNKFEDRAISRIEKLSIIK